MVAPIELERYTKANMVAKTFFIYSCLKVYFFALFQNYALLMLTMSGFGQKQTNFIYNSPTAIKVVISVLKVQR
jgi:hypothetical protein